MILCVATFYTVASLPRPWTLVVAIACYLALLFWCLTSETKP